MAVTAIVTHVLAQAFAALDKHTMTAERAERDEKAAGRQRQGQPSPTTSISHRVGVFCFLDLPPDLRNCVYDHVFAPLDAKSGTRIPLIRLKPPSRERLKRKFRSKKEKRRSELSLLCVNKQKRSETSSYIWRGAYVTLHVLDGAWKKEFVYLYGIIHGGRIGWQIEKLDVHIGHRLREVRRLELTGIDTLYFLLRTNDDEVGQAFERRKLGFMYRELEATKRRLIIARQALPNLECLVVCDESFDEFCLFNVRVPLLPIFLFEPLNSPVRLRIAFPELQTVWFQGREFGDEYYFCDSGNWHWEFTGRKLDAMQNVDAQTNVMNFWRTSKGLCSILWM